MQDFTSLDTAIFLLQNFGGPCDIEIADSVRLPCRFNPPELEQFGLKHSTYLMDGIDIFPLSRKEEVKHLKTLDSPIRLLHSSCRANWTGILVQGLRIAPPCSPSTSCYYFSDKASEFAIYRHNLTQSLPVLSSPLQVACGENDCFTGKVFRYSKSVDTTAPSVKTYLKTLETGVVYLTDQSHLFHWMLDLVEKTEREMSWGKGGVWKKSIDLTETMPYDATVQALQLVGERGVVSATASAGRVI
eukprot:TsM_000342300 transcript=TsM_000342300 gene=TsM_000342300